MDNSHSPFLAKAAPFAFAVALASLGITATSAQATTIVKYNAAAFNNALEKGKSVVVHVHAKWCITCVRQEKPLKVELSKPAFSKIIAYRVNFDTDKAFLQKYRINTQSTIMIFKKGQLVMKSVGQTNQGVIAAILRKAL